jgi:autoinducer 2 (AI-2) kinase
LPKIYETGTVISLIKKDIASVLGLSFLTKIVSGGGDVQLGSLGLGVVKSGQVAILGGSFWQQIVNIPKDTQPPKDLSIRVNSHVIDSLSQAEGITFFSGLVMRWFRDAFCDIEKLQAKEQNIDVYTLLEQKASKVPVGSYEIMPIFSHSMNYGKWYHASPSFINLNIDPTICNKASIFRSLEENAAIVSYINLQKIEQFTNMKFDTIVFASGASKGDLWCQILADVTNCTIKVPVVKEATSLGTAIAAGVGAGIFKSLEDGAKISVKFQKEYKPNKQNHTIYKNLSKKWEEIYKTQLELVDKNLTTSMWKAPGV